MKFQNNLRKFQKSDFDCFAGVSSNDPKIHEANTFTLVVDNNYVEVTLLNELTFSHTFTDFITAENIANMIITMVNNGLRISDVLIKMGFDRI